MIINNNNNNNDNGDNDDDGFQVQKPYNLKTVKYFTLMNLFHFSLNWYKTELHLLSFHVLYVYICRATENLRPQKHCGNLLSKTQFTFSAEKHGKRVFVKIGLFGLYFYPKCFGQNHTFIDKRRPFNQWRNWVFIFLGAKGGGARPSSGGPIGRHRNEGCTIKSQMGEGQWGVMAPPPQAPPPCYATVFTL